MYKFLSFSIVLTVLFLATSCSSFDKKELHGAWQNELLYLNFNEDNSLELKMGGDDIRKGKYTIFGNTIELINDEGIVELNLTVVKIENDSLYINMMKTGSDNVKALARVK